MRIMICGPSGAGKTTIAKHISEEYKLPYIHTSGPELRVKYGCNNHAEVIRMSAMDPLKGLNYQQELLAERAELAKQDNYVMDRSIVDSVAYFMLQNACYLTAGETFNFIASAVSYLPRVDHLIFIPPLYAGPENDGVRIDNIHYQKMTWQIMQYVSLEFFKMPVMSTAIPHYGSTVDHPRRLLLNRWDLQWRKDQVRRLLTNQ